MAADAPYVTVNNLQLGPYEVVSAAQFIKSAGDANGNAVTYFDFGDVGGDGGYFVLDGEVMADDEWITVSAAQLAAGDLLYVSGLNAGSENIEVAAWDGVAWSSIATATATTTASDLPVVQVQDRAVFSGYQIYASSFIASTYDPFDDPITYVAFRDVGGDGGHLALSGVAQADGTWVQVSAADLSEVTYVGASNPGKETIDVEIWDGFNWSAAGPAVAQTLAATPPVVTVQNQTVASGDEIAASSFINTVSDANNFAITYYDFKDVGGDNGYFSLNGVKEANGVWITVSAAELSELVYVGATTAGSETIEVGIYDGFFWSAAVTAAAITTSSQYANPPTVTVKNESLVELHSLPVKSLIASISDPGGHAITYYAFRADGSAGGSLQLAGTPEAANTWITVSAAQLSQLIYVAGSSAASENVDVAVFDGSAWSTAATATIATTAPAVPRAVVRAVSETLPIGGHIQASEFIGSVTAPANDAITSYDFRDEGNDGGYFSLNGAKIADGRWITVSAAQLEQLTYVGASKAGSEKVDVAAFDGQVWSLYATATATTASESLPTVTAKNESVKANASLLGSALVASTSDPGGFSITEYEFRDDGGDGGHISLGGVAATDGQWVEVSAAELATLTYMAGNTNGSETVDIRVYDGHAWSNYASATVTTTGGVAVNPIIAELNNPTIKADVTALLNGGSSLSYAAMLKIVQDAAVGGDTAQKFADLKTLVGSFNKNGGISVSSYVAYISNALVNGDGANANWTGGANQSVALGNLSATTTQADFSELISKWFLGGDLPSPIFDTSMSCKYVADTNPLFNSTGLPAVADINQGDIGDCYLLASLAEIANDQPQVLKSMITVNGNNTWGIEFYISGKPVYVTVNDELPVNTATGAFAANTSSDIWSSLIEKAYVQLNDDPGYLDHTSGNAYHLIDDGSADPITQLTGRSVTTYHYSSYTLTAWEGLKTTIEDAILGGDEVDFGSFGATTLNGETAFVSGHMFSGIGFDKTTGEFIVRNPWGVEPYQTWNTEFEATMSDFYGVNGILFVANGATGSTPPTAAGVVSVAQYLADKPSIDASANGVDIQDTAKDIETGLNTLSADPNVLGIVSSQGSVVVVDVSQFESDQSALLKLSGGFAVSDTAADVTAGLSLLLSDVSHISSISLTGGGSPVIDLTASEAQADAAVLAKIDTAYVLNVASAGSERTTGHGDNLTIHDIAGGDTITGGGLNETFDFGDGFGSAIITDPSASWGGKSHDTLLFEGSELGGFASFLKDASFIGGVAQINVGGDSLTLDGFSSKQQLVAGYALGDFKFG